jgi:hypothetical protein
MTATVNGHRPSVTVGDDVRMCVRAPEIPPEAGPGADTPSGSAYTRAISHDDGDRPASAASKVRDFVSLHKGATEAAVESSWFGRERPSSLYDAAGDVFPAKGEAANWVAWVGLSFSGLLRLTALSVIYLAAFCFDTRIRASVSTIVLVTAATTHNVLS